MSPSRSLAAFVALTAGAAGLLATAQPAHAACLPPQYCGPAYVVPVSRTAANEFTSGADALSSLSADGRYVAFSTSAALVAGDTNDKQDVYRRDLQTNTLVRVSTRAGGGQANDLSLFPAISNDGRYVVFTSKATNLLTAFPSPSAPHNGNVYRKDLATGTIVKVNTTASGANGGPFLDPAASTREQASISSDGRYVAFTSNQTGLVSPDSGNAWEVYRKDLVNGAIVRVSALGAQFGNGASSYPSMSANGRYIAFSSSATNFVTDTNGQADVLRKDLTTGTIVHVSIGQDGSELGRGIQPSMSADGRYVSFTSTPSSDSNEGSIRRKDLTTGELITVSANAGGTPAAGINWRSSISADGSSIAFESTASALITGDTNNTTDMFVKNAASGAIKRVSRTAANQQAVYGGSMAAISDDGAYVSFWTYSALSGADTNNAWDIYRTNIPLAW